MERANQERCGQLHPGFLGSANGLSQLGTHFSSEFRASPLTVDLIDNRKSSRTIRSIEFRQKPFPARGITNLLHRLANLVLVGMEPRVLVGEFLDQADGGILISMAYLKALDNYFEVDEAIILARRAKSKGDDSYTINIICALIEAQKALDSDWCEVYNLANNVRTNQSLNMDMKEDAIKIIFEYMDLYKDNCG